MEIKNTTSKEDGLLQDSKLQTMRVNTADESAFVESEPSYLACDQSQLKGGVADELLLLVKSGPNLNQMKNSDMSGKNEKLQCKEVHSKPEKQIKRNTVIKTVHKADCLEIAEAELDDRSSLGVRVRWEIKSLDLSKEKKDDVIVVHSHRGRNTRKSNDLIEDNEVDNKQLKCMETRLEKIPKHILGKYGLTIEDSDVCRNPQESEERKNLWNDDGEEEEGRLVIDEDERPVRNTDRENSSRYELSGNEADFSAFSLSSKENASGFTNCGHHLVISSVTSLQWSERCNICEVQLPNGDSLELHKKGHCSFPGCLDFIQDDSERQKHLQIHKAHPIKPFRCEYCKKRFHYYRFTKKHREVCKVLKRSKCPYCHYSSPKVGQFNKHVAKHVNKSTARIAGKAKFD